MGATDADTARGDRVDGDHGDAVVVTRGLRKEFRSRGRRLVAVDDLDLSVPAGGVHGFLGPNGSGKTTTFRMLLGLSRPSAGEIRLFDEPVPRALPSLAGRVGAVVGQPRFVPGFSARKNLSLLARSTAARTIPVPEALARVGLERRGRDRFGTFSFGMRQRLAIAAALLTSPRLLLLDEPTNGLDPAGIHDIRTMVRELAEGGVTVLLSSHVLAEVQQICHSVSIVDHGRLLASGPVADLVGDNAPATFRVDVADPHAAAAVLRRRYRVDLDEQTLVVQGAGRGEDLTRALAEQGLFVDGLTRVGADLESVFLQLTRGDDAFRRGGGPA